MIIVKIFLKCHHNFAESFIFLVDGQKLGRLEEHIAGMLTVR